MKRFLSFVFLSLFICNNLLAQTSWEGAGTQESPYLIKTTDDWKALIDSVSLKKNNNHTYADYYFRLENDLDFNNETIKPVGITYAKCFSGNFDGNGHTIKNVVIASNTKSSSLGLFGYVTNGNINNLNIKNLSISLNSGSTDAGYGCLVGCYQFSNALSITNCSVTNSTVETNNNNVGGLVGKCKKPVEVVFYIDSCSVTNTTLKGNNQIGGLIGGTIGVSELSITNVVISNNIIKATTSSSIVDIGNIIIDNYNYNNDLTLYVGRWNFIAALDANNSFTFLNHMDNGNDCAALQFDYDANNWSNEYLYVSDEPTNYAGYFVWPFTEDVNGNAIDNSITFISESNLHYLTDNEITIPTITNNGDANDTTIGEESGAQSLTAHWFAFANPFATTLDTATILSNLHITQGGVVYVYSSNINAWQNPATVSPGQGFFVASAANSDTISGKIANLSATTKKSVLKARKEIRFTCKTEQAEKQAIAIIDENASNGFDINDAYVMFANNNEEIVEPYFEIERRWVLKNELRDVPCSFAMNFHANKTHMASLEVENPYSDIIISITDKQSGITTILDNDTKFDFIANEGENEDRFQINFSKSSVTIEDAEQIDNQDVQISTAGDKIIVTGKNLKQVFVYNALGQNIISKSISGDNYSFAIPRNGYYLVKVLSHKGGKSQGVIIR